MKKRLDRLYGIYNDQAYIHPDPLEYVYRYQNQEDREIVAIISACLAFGRVSQILGTLSNVFQVMGSSPRRYLEKGDDRIFSKDFSGFIYRFVRGEHLVALLSGLKNVVDLYGSLENCFITSLSHGDETVFPALTQFVGHICGDKDPGYLLAKPEKGSAMKRLNLFLRWMVRKDSVDPGGWEKVSTSQLIIPLDTHMHRMAKIIGLTQRNQANMKTAIEITGAFRTINPADPVKYDFTLTRFGIRSDLDLSHCLSYLRPE